VEIKLDLHLENFSHGWRRHVSKYSRLSLNIHPSPLNTKTDKETNPYDWAIVLGGTNDLSVEYEIDDIYEALQKVWAIPLSHGTKVLALTVPECGFDDSPITAHGDGLNKLIMEHEAQN
jgi:hypothetical protein